MFVYCVWVGRKFTKRCAGHWAVFFFFPTAFLIVAFFSLLISESPYGLIYSMSLWTGCLVGLIATNRVPIKIDVACQTIYAPGSSHLLIGLLLLCVSRCGINFFITSMPEYAWQFQNISWILKGAVTGMLFGQAISFFYRFSTAAKSCKDSELLSERFVFFVGLKKVSRAHYFVAKKLLQ